MSDDSERRPKRPIDDGGPPKRNGFPSKRGRGSSQRRSDSRRSAQNAQYRDLRPQDNDVLGPPPPPTSLPTGPKSGPPAAAPANAWASVSTTLHAGIPLKRNERYAVSFEGLLLTLSQEIELLFQMEPRYRRQISGPEYVLHQLQQVIRGILLLQRDTWVLTSPWAGWLPELDAAMGPPLLGPTAFEWLKHLGTIEYLDGTRAFLDMLDHLPITEGQECGCYEASDPGFAGQLDGAATELWRSFGEDLYNEEALGTTFINGYEVIVGLTQANRSWAFRAPIAFSARHRERANVQDGAYKFPHVATPGWRGALQFSSALNLDIEGFFDSAKIRVSRDYPPRGKASPAALVHVTVTGGVGARVFTPYANCDVDIVHANIGRAYRYHLERQGAARYVGQPNPAWERTSEFLKRKQYQLEEIQDVNGLATLAAKAVR